MYLRIKLINMKSKLTLFLGLLIVFVFSALAKDDPITELLKKLEEFTKKYPIERVHIHLDKPYYEVGDDIWFKAYVKDSKTLGPTSISKILYVELIDEKNNSIKQLKLPLVMGITNGDFKLPTSLDEGNYRIIAYTQWMRNAGLEFFFDHKISINNILKDKISTTQSKLTSKSIAEQTPTLDVQFFSEGGNLVRNLPSKIAIKAVNSSGIGQTIKGLIIDDNNSVVTNFETSHLGMGSFLLNPQLGKSYRAKIISNEGNERIIDLPKIEESGYILNVNADSIKLLAKIFISDDLLNQSDLSLIAHQYGRTIFSAKIATSKNYAAVSLPLNDFPSGISTITLFNNASIPVAERLIFINHQTDHIKIEPYKLNDVYSKNEEINLVFSTNIQQDPVMGSFSVSVTDENLVVPNIHNETNIYTDFLMKSDLKGYIETPNYYFIDDSLHRKLALDHLMLTQGWRKIDWKTIKDSTLLVQSFAAESGLKISGIATNNDDKPVANAKITLMSSYPEIFVVDTITNINGQFVFENLNFSDSSQIVIQAINDKGKPNIFIKLDSLPNQVINPSRISEQTINSSKSVSGSQSISYEQSNKQVQPSNLNKTINLKKVDINADKKPNATNTSLNGARRADVLISAKQLENAVDLPTVLSKSGLRLSSSGVPSLLGYNDAPMLIVVDGMQQSSSMGVNMYMFNVLDVESVEILKSPSNTSLYGSFGGNGVLVITTKKGIISGTTIKDKLIRYSPKGYAASRTFYTPKHDINQNNKPNNVKTVYWNPSLLSDIEGKLNVSLNTGNAGKYRVVIEGIDEFGNIGRNVFTYQVN
jgi:TonB-dependent SusC/RagA subfamily outer membrane receptor